MTWTDTFILENVSFSAFSGYIFAARTTMFSVKKMKNVSKISASKANARNIKVI